MRATLANKDGALVPGLFARVQLAGTSGAKPTVLINERAVSTDQSRKFVFVVGAGNKAEYRAVTLGPQVDGMRVVREGLKPGEKIVVNGLQRVRPGAPISPTLVPMDSDPLAANVAKPEAKPEAKKDEKVAVVANKTGTSKE